MMISSVVFLLLSDDGITLALVLDCCKSGEGLKPFGADYCPHSDTATIALGKKLLQSARLDIVSDNVCSDPGFIIGGDAARRAEVMRSKGHRRDSIAPDLPPV